MFGINDVWSFCTIFGFSDLITAIHWHTFWHIIVDIGLVGGLGWIFHKRETKREQQRDEERHLFEAKQQQNQLLNDITYDLNASLLLAKSSDGRLVYDPYKNSIHANVRLLVNVYTYDSVRFQQLPEVLQKDTWQKIYIRLLYVSGQFVIPSGSTPEDSLHKPWHKFIKEILPPEAIVENVHVK